MGTQLKEFIFNGKGAVTFQVTTLILMLTMIWQIATWKSKIEFQIATSTQYRWTSIDMSEWAYDLARDNKNLEVPDVFVD